MEHGAAFMKLLFFFLCVLIFFYKAGKTETNHDRRHAVSSLLAELNLPSTAY